MQLKDIMTPNVECVRPGDTLQEAARKMKDLDVGPMPVCGDNDKIVGMLTDRDITIRSTAAGTDPTTAKVSEAMTRDLVFCFDDQDVKEVAKMMKDKQIRRLVVLDREETENLRSLSARRVPCFVKYFPATQFRAIHRHSRVT